MTKIIYENCNNYLCRRFSVFLPSYFDLLKYEWPSRLATINQLSLISKDLGLPGNSWHSCWSLHNRCITNNI